MWYLAKTDMFMQCKLVSSHINTVIIYVMNVIWYNMVMHACMLYYMDTENSHMHATSVASGT